MRVTGDEECANDEVENRGQGAGLGMSIISHRAWLLCKFSYQKLIQKYEGVDKILR